MAKLSIEVSRYARRDGTRKVSIRLSHGGHMRRLPTSLIAYPEDLTRMGKIRSRSLKDRADALVREMYLAIDSLSYFDLRHCDVDFLAKRIESANEREHFRLDFFQFAADHISRIKNSSTQKTYEVAVSAFRRYIHYLHLPGLDINEITSEMLCDFAAYLDNEKKLYYLKSAGKVEVSSSAKKPGIAAKAYLIKLGAIFSAAKSQYNNEDENDIRIPRSPYGRVTIHTSPSAGQQPLGIKEIRKIVTASAATEFERAALDTFIVSLGLMGANLADLFEATPPENGIWRYFRKKTRTRRQDAAEMRVRVPECLDPYLARLTRHSAAGRWLNLSWRYSSMPSANKTINDLLKRWAIRNSIPPFTLYAARKTWATIAHSRVCGVDKATVDECLGHVGDLRVADIYIQRDWELLWEANTKVIDIIWHEE